jgi:hypothetical protein
MRTYLRDGHNRLIGWTVEDSNRIRIFDDHSQLKGWYDKKQNATYDNQSRRVGTENQLTRLLL